MSPPSSHRWLLLGITLGFAASLAPACGPAKLPCNASTCNGCCDTTGSCQLTNSPNACGSFGQRCQVCTAGQVCNLGICTIPTSGTGGGSATGGGTNTGGGLNTGGGTGGGGGGNVATCSGCIASGQCVDITSSNSNAFCGIGGAACTDCRLTGSTCANFQCTSSGTGGGTGGGGTGGGGGSACAGCRLPSGACLSVTTSTNCGSNGAACAPCPSGQQCSFGQCTSAPSSGNIGDPCTSPTSCTGVPTASGFPALCKTTTLGGNTPYPNGYCTRRCTEQADCGANGICEFALGPAGELENICLKRCTGTGTCGRTGYECLNVGSSANPVNACWLTPVPQATPGAGNPGTAGGACTLDSQCGSPSPTFSCVATFPGGMCTGNCSVSLDDAWCGTGGVCVPGVADDSSGRGTFVTWACYQGCTVGTSTCRSSYVCTPITSTSNQGVCLPDCRVKACDTGLTCNTSTGICE